MDITDLSRDVISPVAHKMTAAKAILTELDTVMVGEVSGSCSHFL